MGTAKVEEMQIDDNSGPAEADEMTGVKTVIDHEGIQEIEMSDA
jgi:hypothetical protein